MTILKPCPFCKSIQKIKFDTIDYKYYIECNLCKKSDITLICKADTIEKVIEAWNNRWFDNNLLLNKEEYQKFIDNYYYSLSVLKNPKNRDRVFEVKSEVTSEIQMNQESYGYLIFDTGEVLDCNIYGHPELLLQRYGINEYVGEFDHCKFCAEHSIIKLTIFNMYLTIDIPIKYTKKQIDACFETLLQSDYLKQITKFSIFFNKTAIFQTFYTLDELLKVLDRL